MGDDSGSVLMWIIIVVVVTTGIVLLGCINHIVIPMFSNVVKDEKKKEDEEEEEATGAMVMCDVSLSIENENFQLESCVPLKTIKSEEGLQSEIMELRNKLKISECKGVQVEHSATKRSYDATSCLHDSTR
jgi:hypothetical protein